MSLRRAGWVGGGEVSKVIAADRRESEGEQLALRRLLSPPISAMSAANDRDNSFMCAFPPYMIPSDTTIDSPDYNRSHCAQ